MQVNISDIKSKWVGESEKNIKAIFTRYRKLVAESDVAPILLFNEADAVIGKRLEEFSEWCYDNDGDWALCFIVQKIPMYYSTRPGNIFRSAYTDIAFFWVASIVIFGMKKTAAFMNGRHVRVKTR